MHNKKHMEAFPDMPAAFHARVAVTLESLDSVVTPRAQKKRLQKPARVALAAAVVAAALTVSVFAVSRGWLVRNGRFGLRVLADPAPQTDAEPATLSAAETRPGDTQPYTISAPDVALVWDYMPDWVVPTDDYEKFHMKNAAGDEVWMMTIQLYTWAGADALDMRNVGDVETCDFGAHEGAILRSAYDGGERQLLIHFSETGYLLRAYVSDALSDAELKKIAAGFSLVETDRAHAFAPQDAQFRAQSEAASQPVDESPDAAAFAAQAVKTVRHALPGETQTVHVPQYEEDPARVATFEMALQTARLTDSAAGIDQSCILDYMLQNAVAADGAILPRTRRTWSYGDGVNTLDRLLDAETVGRRLLLLTFDVRNCDAADATFYAGGVVGTVTDPNADLASDKGAQLAEPFCLFGRDQNDKDFWFVPVAGGARATLTIGYLVDADVDPAQLIFAQDDTTYEMLFPQAGAAPRVEIHFAAGGLIQN